jgi:hypothetical protein
MNNMRMRLQLFCFITLRSNTPIPRTTTLIEIRQRPRPRSFLVTRPLSRTRNECRTFRPRIRIPIRNAKTGRQRQSQGRDIVWPIQCAVQGVGFCRRRWRRESRIAVGCHMGTRRVVLETGNLSKSWRAQ